MKSRSLTMGRKQMVLTMGVLCALFLLLPEAAPAQAPAQSPVRVGTGVGKPERVDLGDGRFKNVYRDRAGRVAREEEFITKGTLLRNVVLVRQEFIEEVYPNNGKAAKVRVKQFDSDGEPTEETVLTYDPEGKPVKKITYDLRKLGTRTVTTYPPGSGPEGVSRIEKENPETDEWDPVPSSAQPSTPATPSAAPSTPTTPAQPPSSGGGTTEEVMPVNYRPFEFYAGFSHNRVDAGDEREGFNGFAASFTGNFNRYAGVKGYYSYHTRSFEENGFDFSSRASIHQGFGGVQLKDNVLENGPVRPFGHFLAGLAHHRFNFDDGVGSFSDNQTGFAGVIGGGIDFRLNHRVDLRLQFDYNPNRIDDEWQHNTRAGIGVVFKWGS